MKKNNLYIRTITIIMVIMMVAFICTAAYILSSFISFKKSSDELNSAIAQLNNKNEDEKRYLKNNKEIIDEGKEGDTLEIDNKSVTLKSIELDYKKDDVSVQLPENSQLLVVELELTNNSPEEFAFNPFLFPL